MNQIAHKLSNKEIAYGWSLLCIHIFFMYVRPQEILTFIKPLRLPGIISALLIFWVIKNARHKAFENPASRFVLFFGLLCTVSFVWAEHSAAYRIGLAWLIQLLPVCIAINYLVSTVDKCKIFVGLWCICHLAVFLVIFKNGGKGPGSFLHDENDAALGVAMVIPIILFYSQWSTLSARNRLLLKALFAVAFIAIVATRSRGGLLGLFSVAGMLWLFSKSKFKIALVSILLVAALGAVAVNFLPEGYLEDVKGITDPEDNTRSARLQTWEVAWIMFKDNFVFGVGAGNFPWNAMYYQEEASWWYYGAKSYHGRQTHSLYFELLADMGLVGLYLYFGFIFGTMRKLHRKQKEILDTTKRKSQLISEEEKNLALLCKALFVSVVAFLVSGAFISVGYYPHIAMWGALAYAMLGNLERIQSGRSPLSDKANEEDQHGATGENQ